MHVNRHEVQEQLKMFGRRGLLPGPVIYFRLKSSQLHSRIGAAMWLCSQPTFSPSLLFLTFPSFSVSGPFLLQSSIVSTRKCICRTGRVRDVHSRCVRLCERVFTTLWLMSQIPDVRSSSMALPSIFISAIIARMFSVSSRFFYLPNHSSLLLVTIAIGSTLASFKISFLRCSNRLTPHCPWHLFCDV